MGNTKTAEDLVNNKTVQKYIEAIDRDAEAALDTADANLKYAGLKHYSPKLVSAYRADVKRLDKAWGDFNAAWNKVVFKKAKDSKEIIKTYTQYVLALEILEENNTRHSALVEADFAMIAAGFIALLITATENAAKRCVALEKELKELQKLAEKAKREITEAKVQAGLNIALTAISFCLGPVGLGARIAVAVGGIAVHSIVDASLGPSKGSAIGTANTVAGEVAGVHKKLKPGAQKLAGGASALITLKFDLDEIGDAKKILKEIQKRMAAASKSYQSLMSYLDKTLPNLGKMHKSFETALAVVQKKKGEFRSSKKRREGLLKEFKQWK